LYRPAGVGVNPAARRWLCFVCLVWLLAAAGAVHARAPEDPSAKRLARARANEELLARLTHAFERGETAHVLHALQDSLPPQDLTARLANLLGLALAAGGRHAEAVAAYESGLRREGQRYELHMNLARSLQVLGKAGRAVSEYREAASLAPEELEPQIALGVGLTAYRHFAAAEQALSAAARIAPDDPRVLRARAELADSQGDTALARERWGALEARAPSADSARRLGVLSGAQGAASAGWFERCAERDSSATDCAAAAGTAWLAAGESARAAVLLRRAVEGGAGPEALHNLLLALRAARATGELEAVVAQHPPERGESWGVVALARRDSGHSAAMLEAARRAVAASPDDLGLANILAVALLETGDRQGARQRWEWILTRDPSHPDARANLAALPPR